MWSPVRQGSGRWYDVVGENGSPGLAGMGRRGALPCHAQTADDIAVIGARRSKTLREQVRRDPGGFYKEAGTQAKLRMNEKKDIASVAKAEHCSLKYGSREKKSKK